MLTRGYYISQQRQLRTRDKGVHLALGQQLQPRKFSCTLPLSVQRALCYKPEGRGFVVEALCYKPEGRGFVVEALCYKPEGRGFETQ
jgi:hypothetical protein